MINHYDIPSSSIDDLPLKIEQFNTLLKKHDKELEYIGELDLPSTGRTIEQIDLDANVSNLICTTYFSSKPDPQRKILIEIDDISYIAPWYNSMLKQKLHGIVFHDNLSKTFVDLYQTDKIKFVKCKLGNYSLNDERFIIYYQFFLQHTVSNILLTDGNDVSFNKDPFTLFKTKSDHTIFIGRGQQNKIYQSQWNIDSVNRLAKGLGEDLPRDFYEMAIYNAGVIGGKYATMMFFLRQMCRLFIKVNNDKNNNMGAMHYVLYHYFFPNCRKWYHKAIDSLLTQDIKMKVKRKLRAKNLGFITNVAINYNWDRTGVSKHIFTGHPLNSRFKEFEDDKTVFITHK